MKSVALTKWEDEGHAGTAGARLCAAHGQDYDGASRPIIS